MPASIAIPALFRDAVSAAGGVEAGAYYHDLEELRALLPDCEVVWSSFWREEDISAILESAPRLRWLSSHGAGVERFPLAELDQRNIRLTNGAGLHAVPIAEYVVLGMLAAAKGFPELARAQHDARWLDRPPSFRELAGTEALIVGYGGIGRAVAARLRALEVSVTGVRRRVDGEPGVIGLDGWKARLGEFDWVILCAPLTAASRHLIGARELESMKAGAWLLNIARGELVDQPALVAALRGGQLGGAYLDATDPEPLPADSELWRLPNAIITPHSSWASDRFQSRAARLFLDNLQRFRSGLPLRNLVDLAAGY